MIKRNKHFFTFLFVLFFVSLLLLPGKALAEGENTETKDQGVTVTSEVNSSSENAPASSQAKPAVTVDRQSETHVAAYDNSDTTEATSNHKSTAASANAVSEKNELDDNQVNAPEAEQNSSADINSPAMETQASTNDVSTEAEDGTENGPTEEQQIEVTETIAKHTQEDQNLTDSQGSELAAEREESAGDVKVRDEEVEETSKAIEALPSNSEEQGTPDETLTPEESPETAEDANAEDEAVLEEPNAEVLEKGEVLDVDVLAKNPMALGSNESETSGKVIEVYSFEDLEDAIKNAGSEKTTIKIMKSFTLTHTLTIGKDQDIILTANNEKTADGEWEAIEQPSDYKHRGEKTQREVIEEARRRGEEALDKADLKKNPLPSEEKGDIIIKRDQEFTRGSLFDILGKLTLGTEDTAIYIDGNKDEVQTSFDDRGSVIDVKGNLTLKNGVIMNSYNKHGYTAPIKVKEGGTFTMEGGRISSNTSYEQIDLITSKPTAAGAVYVDIGGTFTMKNGLIDNNNGGISGGIFAGDLFGSSKDLFARVNILGGIIAGNKSNTSLQMGGGITGFPKSFINIEDGIIAGNKSGVGGGIAISDQYIGFPKDESLPQNPSIKTDYKEYIKENEAKSSINGGLIYKNQVKTSGGGVYVDSNDVSFGKTMILDNKAYNFGGGVYVSFPPRVQQLKNLLITENNAKATWIDSLGGGNGGGLWNCPTGYVQIGDGHSVYVFDNNADSNGKDITFSEKTDSFKINGIQMKGIFYSHISPITKDGNIIKFINDKTSKTDIPDNLSYNPDLQHLIAIYNEALQKEAWYHSDTFIMGNTARNGGGLGSNANLETPGDEGDYRVEIEKKWDASVPNKKVPKDIKIDIFIVPKDVDAEYVKSHYKTDNNLFKYGEIKLSEAMKWFGTFEENALQLSKEDRDKLLKDLKIGKWSDIGMPDDIFSRDQGLPFTAEELAAKGLKYLFVEQGDDFLVKVEENLPTEEKKVDAGVVEVERKFNDEWDNSAKHEQTIYFYLYDAKKKQLTRIAQTILNEDNNWESTALHPIFLKEISKREYYGQDRPVIDREGWGDINGYWNTDRGYAIILTENEDGTLTMSIPYIWSQSYTDEPYVGINVYQTDEIDELKLGNDKHTVTITNYGYANLDVEKSWNSSISKKDIPESITIYLRKDGKRVIEGYDKKVNPIYRKLVLTAEDGWTGRFDKLDPMALSAGRYTIEEPSDIFVPLVTNKDGKYDIRIEYADHYHQEGNDPDVNTSTSGHFPSYVFENEDGTFDKIKLNLFLDGKLIDTQEFGYRIAGPYIHFEDNATFKDIVLPNYGMPIRIGSYDVYTNEPGLKEYNFYIERDDQGIYTLFLPRLMINGIPYDNLFIAKELEEDKYGLRDQIFQIPSLADDKEIDMNIENYYGPRHQIEILKKWIDDGKNTPSEITVIVADKDGNEQKIVLTAQDGWKKTLDNLMGLLRTKEYSIKEVEVPNYTGDKKTSLSGVDIIAKDKDGKEITISYNSEKLKEALKSGKYRYQLFEFPKGTDIEFNRENLDQFIRVEQEADGTYIIYYHKDIKLNEKLTVELTNTYDKPETPPEEPPETPKNPPEEPPETPEEPPEEPPTEPPETPETPPEIPKEPPETPKEPLTPIEPPVIPPEKPKISIEIPPTPQKTPSERAPQTYDPGVGIYLALSSMSILGLGILGRKKED